MNKTDLLIDSSGLALNIIEKILDANIEIKGIENIPKHNPRMFIANHFTRIEAILVPFALYKITNKKVGVIADDMLFKTPFGNLLKNLGAIEKSDPFRNNVILGDLLTSSKDWMIFPEGRMVKSKDIQSVDEHYCVNINDTCERVYTGAASFALNSQLLRKYYLDNKIKNPKKFKRKYFLTNNKEVSDNETKIIPINISYSKIRKGDNFLSRMLGNIFPRIGGHFKEEFEIESNIILHSTITINILKPISTNDILKKQYYKELNHNTLIDKYREKLTDYFMTKVYGNLTISFDHVFVLTLYLFPYKEIDLNHLKRLMYLIINDIKNYNLCFTKEIDDFLIDLISYEQHNAFDEIIKIAIRDKIIEEQDGSYSIKKENLEKSYTHDTIRLKNILRVILNEILLIDKVNKIVKHYTNKESNEIDTCLYDILCEQEFNEFESDYNEYSSYAGIKEKKIGQPFTLEANSEICVVALHGFSSAPNEVEKIAKYLNSYNLNVYAPRLKGHGTVPEDLKNTSSQDWYNSVSRAITIASLKYKKIFLLGFSTGGLLALLSSQKNYKQFRGQICINTALNLNDIRVRTLVPAVSFWNDLVRSFNATKYAKEYIENSAQNPDINYNKHYIESILQLSDLMAKTKKSLKNAKTPIYIIQSSDDPVVNPSSAYEIFDAIESDDKILEIIESKYHVIITQENDKLFESINFFIQKNL
jgi:esterase/lipase/1-acyl-sn-glycerol-3-phosphate acyltransferase